MPQEANTTRFGGISQNRMKCFSRGLSLGTKYQAKGAEDSESSDDVDEKEDEGKNIRNRHSSRSGSQVYTYTYQCPGGIIIFDESIFNNSNVNIFLLLPMTIRKKERDDDTPVHPQKTTYITVENNSGELEQLKVLVDETAFGTTTPILQYLTDHGEINLAPDSNNEQQVSGDGQLAPPPSFNEGVDDSAGKFKLPRRGLSRGSSMFNVLQKMTGGQFGTPTRTFQNNKNVAFGELKPITTDLDVFDLEKRGDNCTQKRYSIFISNFFCLF